MPQSSSLMTTSLRDVDEPAGEVAGVGRLEGGVGQALAGAVRRDEELDDRQALAEVRADRELDDVAGGLGHQASHAGELADLVAAAARAGVGHHVDVIEAGAVLLEGLHHHRGELLVRLGPDLDDAVVALLLGDMAGYILLLDGLDLLVRGLDHLGLLLRHDDVVHADGRAEEGRVAEARVLDGVEHLHRDEGARVLIDPLDEVAEVLVGEGVVDVGDLGRHGLVEEEAAGRRVHDAVRGYGDLLAAARPHGALRHGHLDHGLVVAGVGLAGHEHFLGGGVAPALALHAGLVPREEVDAQDHVLRGVDDGLAARGVEEIAAREHEGPALGLRGVGERHVDGHLVAVEVRVVRLADEGVELDGLALDEDGLEGLDAEAVQGRGAVEEDGVLLDHLVEDREDLGSLRLDEHLRLLDVVDDVLLHELLHDEGLEELEGHLGGKAALPHLELGADDDDGAAGVVDALAEEVLAEAPLLALEHVGQRLEGPVRGALHDALLLRVVEEGVDGLLEHALLVADNDVGRVERHQPLQAVVAVDDAAVEVVEIARREAAAVELHHRPELGRDDGDHVEDHPLGLVVRVAEGLDDLDALEEPLVGLRALLDHLRAELGGEVVEVDLLKQRADGLGSHARGEGAAVAVLGLVPLLLGEELHLLEVGVARVDDDVLLVVEDGAEGRDGQVEKEAHAGGHGAVEPDVRHGGGELDVAHALAAHLEVRDLDAAAVADDALVADRLELAAVALPFLGRAEDPLAEEAVLLGAQRAVVDGLGLLHLAVGPGPDHVRAGQANHDAIEILDVSHISSPSSRRRGLYVLYRDSPRRH